MSIRRWSHDLQKVKWNFLAKSLHFLFFAAGGCAYPFMAVFYGSRGIDAEIIGALQSTVPIISFITGPLLSSVADKTQQHKIVLMVCYFIASLTIALIGFVPIVTENVYLLFLVVIIQACVWCSGSLIDYCVLRILGKEKETYGKQRIFGAISWGLVALAIGVLVDRYGTSMYFYGYLFWASILFLVITFGLNRTGGPRGTPNISESEKEKRKPFMQGIRLLISGPLLCLLFSLFIMGGCTSIVSNFLFLFMREYLNAGDTLLGLSISITVIMELPFFFYSARLLRTLGIRGLIITSHVAYITRVIAYTIIPDPWWFLPIELLHGITFACLWAAVVEHASNIAPPGVEATAQGIMNAVFGGLGSGIGAIVGGVVYQRFGPIILFRASAIASSISLIWFLITFRKHHETRYTTLGDDMDGPIEELSEGISLETIVNEVEDEPEATEIAMTRLDETM
eukprot:TRINITY_DN7246_c0_g1_i1.p1 TRINITY_DN7246_c0_g1~~TRINITY_DN7246_c0_g1_i1.p1  ORF type:complete len:455 (+),score=85.32 TRINITY_DN7246_c0_g1_i1:90-1454(+)